MPDVPQDPRQLARDILSGKISLEDLKREQERRRVAAGGRASGGGGIKPMPPQAKTPDRVPLPNLSPPPSAPRPPVQRPIARQPNFPPPQQRPRFPQQQQRTPQRPLPRPAPQPNVPIRGPQPRGPVIDRRTTPPITQPPAAALPRLAAAEKAYAAPAAIRDATRAPAFNARLNIRDLARNRVALRQSILMAEILGQPLALRENF